MTSARIIGAAYELGEHSEPVADLEELHSLEDLRAFLLSDLAGFDRFLSTDASVLELIATAAGKAMSEANVAGEEIDAVILATDSLTRSRVAHDEVRSLMATLGTASATPFTIGMLDCAAPLVAISVAANMVAQNMQHNVLVLAGDVSEIAAYGSRIVAGGSAIASDAASAVVVSNRGSGRTILGSSSDYSPELMSDNLDSHRRLNLRVRAHRRLHERLRSSYAGTWHQPELVVTSNLARQLVTMYLEDMGYMEDRIYQNNVALNAHCLGSDPIINLVDAEAAVGASHQSRLLMGLGVAHSALVLVGSHDDA